MGAEGSAEPGISSPTVGDRSFAYRGSRWTGYGTFGLLLVVLALELSERLQAKHSDYPVLVMLIFVSLVNGALAISRLRDFRGIRDRLKSERQTLEKERAARQQADEALEARIDRDRMDRLDRDWIESAVDPILMQMKGTIVPDEIANLLVDGLGRTLKADFVLYFSAGEFQNDELWKEWHQRTDLQVDLSQLAGYKTSLTDLAKLLETSSRVIAVDDSFLVDTSRHPFPDLLTRSQEIARSWMLIPVGEASHGLGYVWIGMAENARVWSAAEVGFVKKVVTESAQVLVHAWMIDQSTKFAENRAEVERLVDLDKVKNDFIENMNHELRTPLTSIIGYMEVIMDDIDADVDPSLASSLTAVQRNAVRLQILIENLMQLSKTDFDILPLVVSMVDVGHLLGDVVGSLRLGAEDCGVAVTLRLDSPVGDLIIDGDINQLEQVFVNLMSNAIKFTPRGGTVTVVASRLQADGNYVEVKVTDTGIGIPHQEFPNVFKRFFRASTATQASIPGFGIGLSLVHSIVHQHHGIITFDSTVGKGTVFTVRLPARYIATRPTNETR